jgi:hypothetical protein
MAWVEGDRMQRIGIGLSAVSALGVVTAFAADTMPAARQNALVQKYCAVCHTDADPQGGLSLQHFDAAHVAPSLAAMMVSKLTGGASLQTAQSAATNPTAAAVVARKMKGGAMGASGIPRPDQATTEGLIHALAAEATGAHEWVADRTQDPASKAPILTASILREVPAANSAEGAMYRLVLDCNAATHEGEMRVALAPAPKTGVVSGAVDGGSAVPYEVQGAAAISLYGLTKDGKMQPIALPAKTLRLTNLVENESLDFPFSDLPASMRQSLAGCFR